MGVALVGTVGAGRPRAIIAGGGGGVTRERIMWDVPQGAMVVGKTEISSRNFANPEWMVGLTNETPAIIASCAHSDTTVDPLLNYLRSPLTVLGGCARIPMLTGQLISTVFRRSCPAMGSNRSWHCFCLRCLAALRLRLELPRKPPKPTLGSLGFLKHSNAACLTDLLPFGQTGLPFPRRISGSNIGN